MIGKAREIFSFSSHLRSKAKEREAAIGKATSNWVRLNRWLVFLFFVSTSSLMIFYVNNVLVVNQLTKEITQLQRSKLRLENQNNMLLKEITHLESAQRICPMAESMNMIRGKKAPKVIKAKKEQ